MVVVCVVVVVVVVGVVVVGGVGVVVVVVVSAFAKIARDGVRVRKDHACAQASLIPVTFTPSPPTVLASVPGPA